MSERTSAPICSQCASYDINRCYCSQGAGHVLPQDFACQVFASRDANPELAPEPMTLEMMVKEKTDDARKGHWYTEEQVNPLAKRHYHNEEN